jgi:hypothetical protein
MIEYLDSLLTMDAYTWVMSSILAAAATVVLSIFLGGWAKPLLCAPALVLGGVAANHASIVANLELTADKDINTVAVACVGTMLALVAMLLVTRLLYVAIAALSKAPISVITQRRI